MCCFRWLGCSSFQSCLSGVHSTPILRCWRWKLVWWEHLATTYLPTVLLYVWHLHWHSTLVSDVNVAYCSLYTMFNLIDHLIALQHCGFPQCEICDYTSPLITTWRGGHIYVNIYSYMFNEESILLNSWFVFKRYKREWNQCLYPEISPMNERDQIHLNPAAIRLIPTIHFHQQSASSLLMPTLTLSSSTWFFHVLFSLSFSLTFSFNI